MRSQMQPTKKEARPFYQASKIAMLIGFFTLNPIILAIAFFPFITYWAIMNDPEAPEE